MSELEKLKNQFKSLSDKADGLTKKIDKAFVDIKEKAPKAVGSFEEKISRKEISKDGKHLGK